MSTSLLIQDLCMDYGDRRVLDIPELEFEMGEICHLTGRNGAGKTTLLRILAGLQAPSRGRFGLDAAPTPWAQMVTRLRRQVVYLHQQPFMFDASVRDNLSYGLRVTGVRNGRRKRLTDQALEWVGLAPLADRHARTLSGGERQWVALARAWVLRPRVLLLDEPTANMDTESREQTAFLLRRLQNENICLVITNHDPTALAALATRRLHLEDAHLRPWPGTAGDGHGVQRSTTPWPGGAGGLQP